MKKNTTKKQPIKKVAPKVATTKKAAPKSVSAATKQNVSKPKQNVSKLKRSTLRTKQIAQKDNIMEACPITLAEIWKDKATNKNTGAILKHMLPDGLIVWDVDTPGVGLTFSNKREAQKFLKENGYKFVSKSTKE